MLILVQETNKNHTIMTNIKDYKTMSSEEQLRFVADLTVFVQEKLPRLEQIEGAWSTDDRRDMETGLALIGAFPFARDFVTKALRYGDYKARVRRMRIYIDKVKAEVSRGVAVTAADGKAYAFVPALQQQYRRRGRPTREEAFAKTVTAATDDVESRRQQAVARLLGIEVVTNQTLREKNNAELAIDRQMRQQREAAQNPSLFGSEELRVKSEKLAAAVQSAAVVQQPTGQPAATMPGGSAVGSAAPTIADLGETRYHLNQLRILLSPDLQQRVDMVQTLRMEAADAATRAKDMAEHGEQPEAVEPYAQEAAKKTEAYEQIYDEVDTELATIFFRLKNDEPFREQFQKKHRISDLTRIADDLKPYYKKVQSPEFDLRCRTIIEQESPEYAAKVKAEKEKKEEVDGILRYLRRKDKIASPTRIATAKDKYKRLVELLGKDIAKTYKPLVTAIEDEYKKASEEGKAAKAADVSGQTADHKDGDK
jgi:hypothetical protein